MAEVIPAASPFYSDGTNWVLRFDQDLVPATTDGAALGTSALNWSDLFLDSGGVINFDGGSVTLTHAAGAMEINTASGLMISNAGSAPGPDNNKGIHVWEASAGEGVTAHADSMAVFEDVGNTYITVLSSADQISALILGNATSATAASVAYNDSNDTMSLSVPAGSDITLSANEVHLNPTAQVVTQTQVIEKYISKTSIADASATEVFTITTTDEAGNTDGGAYLCTVEGVVGHGVASSAPESAALGFKAAFVNQMDRNGNAAQTTVTEMLETGTAADNAGEKDINTVTMTVVETSQYQMSVQFNIDLTGTDATAAQVYLLVRVVWAEFNTAPVIAAA